jgi:hypothetical protein
MKILFLDIDGVLNHSTFLHDEAKLRIAAGKEGLILEAEAFHGAHQIDPKAVALLNEIIVRTDCKIVLSSSWRINNTVEEMSAILRVHGFEGEIIDATPRTFQIEPGGRWSCRGEEIKRWIDEADLPEDEEVWFVILDDSSDMGPVGHALVRTSWEKGLEVSHVEIAVYHLNEKWRDGKEQM